MKELQESKQEQTTQIELDKKIEQEKPDAIATAKGSTAVEPPAPKPLSTSQVPEQELYTAHIPEGLNLMDVDVIKLTAQFVARNGKSFLTGLASREHANPRFNFLKPTHSLFGFFTCLCDAYSRVLMPPKMLFPSLRNDSRNFTAPLERAFNRLEFERMKSIRDKEAAEAAAAEENAMQSVDWHEFEIVETIDFISDEEEELPQPISLVDAMQLARTKQYGEAAQETVETAIETEAQVMDDEERALVKESRAEEEEDTNMEVSDEDEDKPIRIVKNYQRPIPKAGVLQDSTRYVISPLTGELVPMDQMGEHMRVSLIDPRWKTQREAMLSKIKETTKASDEEISRNLSFLAKTRPDVFGGDKEMMSTALGKQIDLERAEKNGDLNEFVQDQQDTKRQRI